MAKPPGSSIWLIPPHSTPLYDTLQHLISTEIPSIFSSPSDPSPLPLFTPHVTLSADNIPPFTSSSSPFPSAHEQGNTTTDPQSKQQTWFNSLPLATLPSLSTLHIRIQIPQPGTIFFRKLSLRVDRSPELLEIAAKALAAWDGDLDSALEWVREGRREGGYAPHLSLMYSDLPTAEVESKLENVGSAIRGAKGRTPGSTKAKGGEIWLVPTERSIEEWKPVARRSLPETVEWSWEG